MHFNFLWLFIVFYWYGYRPFASNSKKSNPAWNDFRGKNDWSYPYCLKWGNSTWNGCNLKRASVTFLNPVVSSFSHFCLKRVSTSAWNEQQKCDTLEMSNRLPLETRLHFVSSTDTHFKLEPIIISSSNIHIPDTPYDVPFQVSKFWPTWNEGVTLFGPAWNERVSLKWTVKLETRPQAWNDCVQKC